MLLSCALAKAQAEMPVAIFDAQNKFLNNKYATLGAVISASRPILAKHRLSIVQFPISDAESVGVESMLVHESGEFVSHRVLIPLADEKGKTKVQCAGSVLTYLRRYSWSSILGMYADDDSDGSAAVQSFSAKSSTPKLPPPPTK